MTVISLLFLSIDSSLSRPFKKRSTGDIVYSSYIEFDELSCYNKYILSIMNKIISKSDSEMCLGSRNGNILYFANFFRDSSRNIFQLIASNNYFLIDSSYSANYINNSSKLFLYKNRYFIVNAYPNEGKGLTDSSVEYLFNYFYLNGGRKKIQYKRTFRTLKGIRTEVGNRNTCIIEQRYIIYNGVFLPIINRVFDFSK